MPNGKTKARRTQKLIAVPTVIGIIKMKSMSALDKFSSWLEKDCKQNQMLCHFYYQPKKEDKGKKRKNYSNVDFAYFNLFSKSKYWIVKGTIGHGVDPTCEVPILNFFKINKKFIDALNKPVNEWIYDYELGIVLDREKLTYAYGETNLQDVEKFKYSNPKNQSRPTWCLDKAWNRKGALDPFNMCDVVRLRIFKNKRLGLPMKALSNDIIRAVLVKWGNCYDVQRLLREKKWNDIDVFPLLPNP